MVLGEFASREHNHVKVCRRMKLTVSSIGRISKGLLIPLASTVDIVEPIKKFTDQLAGVAGIGQIYNSGLESWSPEEGTKYNLIWNQWCLGHLTDAQLIAYLKKCGGLLARSEDGKVTGLCVVKENLTVFDDMFDETDSSVTRYVRTLRHDTTIRHSRYTDDLQD